MLDIEELEDDCGPIKKKKASLIGKFKPTQTKKIRDANLLAVFLLAQGRNQEAKKLLVSYACNIPISEIYFERWEAACQAIVMLSLLYRGDSTNEADRLRRLVLNDEIFLTEGPKESLFFSLLKQYECELKNDAFELQKSELLSLYGQYYQIFAYYFLVGSEYNFKAEDIELAGEKCEEILCELNRLLV